MKANVKFAEVEILGWPVYLILVTSTILEGEELLVDYDLDNFWGKRKKEGGGGGGLTWI